MNTQDQAKARKLVIAAAIGSVIGLTALGTAHLHTSQAAEPAERSHFMGGRHVGPDQRAHNRGSRHRFGEHIEGRLAFLRTELHITDAQAKVWDAFANALRAESETAQAKREERKAQMEAGAQTRADRKRPTVVERLERSELRLTAALERYKKLKTAVEPLYAALSEDQKELADKLFRFGPGRRG